MYGVQVRDIQGTMKNLNMQTLVRHIQQLDRNWYFLKNSEYVVELEFSLAPNSKYALTETPFGDIDRIPSYAGSTSVAKVFYDLSGNKLRFSFSAISSNYFYAIKQSGGYDRVRINKLVIEYV